MKGILGFLGARPGCPDATIPGMTGRPAAHIQTRIGKGDREALHDRGPTLVALSTMPRQSFKEQECVG